MKKIIYSLFFFLLLPQLCFTQWYLQTSGTAANLNSVHFENANNGWTVGASGTILHTINGGDEWITQTSGTSKHLNEVWFADLNTGWVVGDSGKILKTSNGGQDWIEQTSETNFHLNSVCFTDMNKGWVVGEGIILHTNDGGTVWVEQSNDTLQPGLNSVCFFDSITGWVGVSPLLRTTDGGYNWIEMEAPPGDGVIVGQFLDRYTGWVSVWHVGVAHGNIIYTTNGGIDWFYGEGNPSAYSIYFIDSNNGWAVGFRSMGCESNIYISIDGGVNWIAQTQITFEQLNSVYFTDLNNGWAVGSNGTILHTTNGGIPVELTSFTATANNKEVILNWSTATEINSQGFEIERASSSTTAVQEWKKIGFVSGFGTTTEPKSYSYLDRPLSIGKYYYRLRQVDFNGAYEYSEVVEVEWCAFNSYLLEQNYPNPFNPITTIKFSVPKTSKVKLTLFNLLGEEVATLVNEEKNAGNYTVEFNATNLPSGVYFYQLKAGELISTKKMILLK